MTPRSSGPRRISRGLCLVFWLGSTLGAGLARGAETIPWRTDLRDAEREARANDRLLWVQFTGSWCPSCVRLERESFVHPRVVGQSRSSFIPVKLQADQHEELVDRYGLTGIPATILIAPGGEVVARHEGYVDAATFHAFLEDALTRSGRSHRVSPTSMEVALAGYCPVSLVDKQRLVPGQQAVSQTYNGVVYRFADVGMRDAFRKQPGRFLPVNDGRCPVTLVDRNQLRSGEPRWSVRFRDRLFLCADEEGRARFLSNPERYAHVAVPLEARRLDVQSPKR